MMPSILIADDNSAFLWILAEVIGDAGFRVAAAPDGPKAVELFREERADIVLLDFNMPGISGIEAMRQIKEMRPAVPVFIMSGEGDIPTALSAMKHGAHDFIIKPMDFDELLSTLKKAVSAPVQGNPTEVHGNIVHEMLSEREREIMALTAEGHSGTTIGDRLSISPRTVETYRKRIMSKLGLRNKADMIRFAVRNDILKKSA